MFSESRDASAPRPEGGKVFSLAVRVDCGKRVVRRPRERVKRLRPERGLAQEGLPGEAAFPGNRRLENTLVRPPRD